MSIAEMKTYLELCLKGQKTIVERQQMLELKMKDLELKMHELQESMDFIRWKQQFYNDVLAGKTPYYSNLTLD